MTLTIQTLRVYLLFSLYEYFIFWLSKNIDIGENSNILPVDNRYL